jgi:hypothetical protein
LAPPCLDGGGYARQFFANGRVGLVEPTIGRFAFVTLIFHSLVYQLQDRRALGGNGCR